MYRTVTIQYRYLLSASNADGGIITTIEKKTIQESSRANFKHHDSSQFKNCNRMLFLQPITEYSIQNCSVSSEKVSMNKIHAAKERALDYISP